jgi:type I restriction enzyme S subunit
MAKLIEITGKALSGEWGTDDINGDGIPVLRTTNFTNEGVVNYKDVVTRIIKKKNIDEKYLRLGDILIEKSGGSDKFPVGRVIYFDGPEKIYLFNNFTGLLRVKDQRTWYPKYIFYSLFANYKRGGTRLFENKTTGLHNLKIDNYVSKYDINELNMEKQINICNKLDKLYGIVKLRQEELKHLETLIKSRFVEMFGDPVSNSKRLSQMPLSELGELGRGVSKHRPRNAPELLGGIYPLIQTGEVADADLYITSYKNTYSELGFQQSKMWSKGTLCITIAANIAKTAILSFDACFPDSVVGFNANEKTCNIFIHYWFSFFQAILESQAPESAQKNINLKILSDLMVIVPPIELQQQFVDFVAQVNKYKLHLRKYKTTAEKNNYI